mmetsp:Transcript_15095/g.28100  ORF Transcript_15095/g.28100 Transcript_15095/m.28100 type:complete len:297 (+) Transcript_15095:108-998(+)
MVPTLSTSSCSMPGRVSLAGFLVFRGPPLSRFLSCASGGSSSLDVVLATGAMLSDPFSEVGGVVGMPIAFRIFFGPDFAVVVSRTSCCISSAFCIAARRLPNSSTGSAFFCCCFEDSSICGSGIIDFVVGDLTLSLLPLPVTTFATESGGFIAFPAEGSTDSPGGNRIFFGGGEDMPKPCVSTVPVSFCCTSVVPIFFSPSNMSISSSRFLFFSCLRAAFLFNSSSMAEASAVLALPVRPARLSQAVKGSLSPDPSPCSSNSSRVLPLMGSKSRTCDSVAKKSTPSMPFFEHPGLT